MKYRQLGRTGLYVSEICLGTMTFGGQGFWTNIGSLDQNASEALVSRAMAAGVNFIDTADVYSEGQSEKILGQALKNLGVKRSDIVIATKVHGAMGEGPNDRGASRAHIMDGVKRSLERLQLDHIDLYQIHGDDPVTPVEETVRALDDLVREGLVRYVGCSNWQAWKMMKALSLSEFRAWARFETVQAYYSIAGRDLERDIVPMLNDQKMGLMVWSPLAGGFLSGKYSRNGEGAKDGRRANFDFPPLDKTRADKCIDVMREVGEAHGVSVARVALAWVLSKPFVTSVIVGAKRVEQLEDNLAAADLTLTPEQIARLDEVSALPGEYPGWMVERQGAGRMPKDFTPKI
jgi:aryl-alcohol dehydrogenase-like predicted oxidoreductase